MPVSTGRVSRPGSMLEEEHQVMLEAGAEEEVEQAQPGVFLKGHRRLERRVGKLVVPSRSNSPPTGL